MKKSGDRIGRSATRGRSNPSAKDPAAKTSKLSSLTSSATDEEFYSSLAQMAGDNDDDDEDSMTELDAKHLADSLAGMDDLDSDLFGNSLGRKSTPKPTTPKPTTPKPTTPKPKGEPPKTELASSKQSTVPTKQDKPVDTMDVMATKPASKANSKSVKSGKKFDISKYDSMDFDEDDPLAGLLSDDEDAKSKPKKKTKKQPVKKEPEPKPTDAEIERPRTSRSRREDNVSQDPPSSTEQKPESRNNTLSLDDGGSLDNRLSSPESKDESAPLSPRPRGRRSPSKSKDELSFDSGDDLPGMDDSPRVAPNSKQTTNTSASRGKTKRTKPDHDLFGDDDGLLGLDEGKQSTKSPIPKQPTASRFDELLGGKKEQSEAKPQKPKTLDDFMSNISTTKPSDTTTKKAPAPKDDEDSFQFGGYMPSAAASSGRGRSRPDTAPGPSRRTVRFADDLGLSDDILDDTGRPATAPSQRAEVSPRRRRGLGMESGGSSSFEDDSSKKEKGATDIKPNKDKDKTKDQVPGGSGADWLGLGSGDPGLELELPTYKPPAPSKPVVNKAESERITSPQQTRPRDTPSRVGRRQEDAGEDDFLKMLGIAADEQTSQDKLSLDESLRRGRRWRDQSPEKGDSLDLSLDNASRSQPEVQPSSKRDQVTRDKSPEARTALHQQKTDDQQTEPPVALQGMRDQKEEITARDFQQPDNSLSRTRNTGNPNLESPKTTLERSSITSQQDQHANFSYKATQHASYQSPQVQHGHPVIPKAQSTPIQIPPQVNQSIGNDPKAQLEGEIQGLLRRLHDMESSVQKQEVDGAGYLAQLEAKVRRLELEIDHLQSTLDSLKHRHQAEIANIETSHKAHIKTLEDSYHLRETRIKEETELQAGHYNDRMRALEDEKTAMMASHSRKMQSLELSRTGEVDRLKELQRRAIEEMRTEHEDEVQRFRRLKEQEVSAVASAHGQTKSLQSLMQQVLNSTKDVSDMKSQIEATHKSSMSERELAARARDEYLTQLQDRLVKQQVENDEERARLQGLIAKMEIHIREQTRQVDQEKWKMTQDESRVKALQASLEDERRITMEQIAADRAELQRARDELLREQKRVTIELQEERRSVAMERAQLSSAHREIITREKHKTDSTIQAEAELEINTSKIKQDTAALKNRHAQLKEEEERLAREKRDFELRVDNFEEEKDRIGKLSLEVQRRSEEIGELCAEGARAREEGDEALVQAAQLRQETENERAELENRIIILHEKERQLAQDRVSIAHERRLLEKDKRDGRCRHCEAKPMELADMSITSPTPALTTYDLNGSSQSLLPKTPDLLLNSLELKRNFRKWDSDKEKDEEFLEQESMFLSGLQKHRKVTRSRQSPTVYQ